jgi:ATP-dependent DNA helicase PIF1
MQLEQTPANIAHAVWLFNIGSGKNTDENDMVDIPQAMCCPDNSIDNLISSTYPDIGLQHGDDYFLGHTILSCKNDGVGDINAAVLEKFPGQTQILQSADSAETDNEDVPYPMEYLNSLNTLGLPLAKLALETGVPVMVLHNLDPTQGLCNGTCLIVTDIRLCVPKC